MVRDLREPIPNPTLWMDLFYLSYMIRFMNLSQQLKMRRMNLGLSLAQVAERAGTSMATLSRYENGWQRFEVYTLKKLATVLGCRLHIELVVPETKALPSNATTPASVARSLKRLFWDKPLKAMDLKQHPVWVVARVLEMGRLEDIHTLEAFMGRDRFLECIADVRFSSRRTEIFWKHILEREGVPCTKKCFQREAGSY